MWKNAREIGSYPQKLGLKNKNNVTQTMKTLTPKLQLIPKVSYPPNQL